jgi:hypothetical protein
MLRHIDRKVCVMIHRHIRGIRRIPPGEQTVVAAKPTCPAPAAMDFFIALQHSDRKQLQTRGRRRTAATRLSCSSSPLHHS